MYHRVPDGRIPPLTRRHIHTLKLEDFHLTVWRISWWRLTYLIDRRTYMPIERPIWTISCQTTKVSNPGPNDKSNLFTPHALGIYMPLVGMLDLRQMRILGPPARWARPKSFRSRVISDHLSLLLDHVAISIKRLHYHNQVVGPVFHRTAHLHLKVGGPTLHSRSLSGGFPAMLAWVDTIKSIKAQKIKLTEEENRRSDGAL